MVNLWEYMISFLRYEFLYSFRPFPDILYRSGHHNFGEHAVPSCSMLSPCDGTKPPHTPSVKHVFATEEIAMLLKFIDD